MSLKVPVKGVQEIDIATCPCCSSKKDSWQPIFQVELVAEQVDLWQCMICKALLHTKVARLDLKQ